MSFHMRVALAFFVLAALAFAQGNAVPYIDQPTVPDAVPPGNPAFVITVHGSGFASTAKVFWNGNPRNTHFLTSSLLRAQITAADVGTGQTAAITVRNPTPGGGVSNTVYFQVRRAKPSIAFNNASYGVGQEPFEITSADFNGDSNQDLAVANVSGDNVSILLGKANGTFNSSTEYPAGPFPVALVAGDFNHDHLMDLAVANGGNASNGKPGTVSVLLTKKGGGFESPITTPCGTGPIAIVAGDFNGDGRLDIGVADYNLSFGNTVAVLLGRGDGTFKNFVTYQTGAAPEGLATADVNGDGILDLVTANEVDDTVSVLLGNGDGTFQGNLNYAVGGAPIAVAIADVNRDNKPDLAVANLTGDSVSVLLGNADGTFQAHVDYPVSEGPVAVTIADFNGDNRQDLAVVDETAGSVSLLLGKGDGTFHPAADSFAGSEPQGVTFADFNHDGRLDLATVNVFSNIVEVLLQK